MHRLLVPTEALASDAPLLSDGARRHLKVLRPKEGEHVELFDGAGAWRVYAWRGGALAPEGVVRRIARPACSLTLFACVTKGSRWDWTIEKATELGVTRIVPVLSERTIVRIPKEERAAKRARWLRIAEDAARQCDAKWLPEVLEAVDFRDIHALVRETTCYVGALTTPPPSPVLSALIENRQQEPGGRYAVFVGPEGDFTPQELSSLLEIAVPVGFGSTVLRAETAAIYGIGAVKAYLDSLPGGGRA